MKRIVAMSLAISLMLIPLIVYATFSDVSDGHWAYGYINALAEGKVINGYEDGTFRPNGTATRAEFFKMMSIVEADDSAEKDFSGEKVNWYDPYVAFIYDNNFFMQGKSRLEDPNEPITRKEATMVLANCAEYNRFLYNVDFDYETNSQEKKFSDIEDFNEEDLYLLNYAVTCGLITGYEDGTFGPEKTMTRAEVATILCRFCNIWVEGVK